MTLLNAGIRVLVAMCLQAERVHGSMLAEEGLVKLSANHCAGLQTWCAKKSGFTLMVALILHVSQGLPLVHDAGHPSIKLLPVALGLFTLA